MTLDVSPAPPRAAASVGTPRERGLYPRFSREEFARRYAPVRALMARHGADVLEDIRHITGGTGTLAYVGEVPVQAYLRWQRMLDGWTFTDLTGAFRQLRLRKSAEELDWLRRGAALTDAALLALVEGVRPGMHEYELGALVEAAALRAGGLPHLYYISSGSQNSSEVCVPRQNLSPRTLARGDVINTGIQLGNLFHITDTGAECLHRVPVQYFVAG